MYFTSIKVCNESMCIMCMKYNIHHIFSITIVCNFIQKIYLFNAFNKQKYAKTVEIYNVIINKQTQIKTKHKNTTNCFKTHTHTRNMT